LSTLLTLLQLKFIILIIKPAPIMRVALLSSVQTENYISASAIAVIRPMRRICPTLWEKFYESILTAQFLLTIRLSDKQENYQKSGLMDFAILSDFSLITPPDTFISAMSASRPGKRLM